jgi:hypothetical protein
LVGVVAEVEVLEVVLVLVGVDVVVEVLVDVDVDVVVVLDEVVGVDGVDVVWWWQSLAASRAIVLAPWARFTRSVGLTVTGRLCTCRFKDALALMAAPQLPDWTAEEIWSACPLSAID